MVRRKSTGSMVDRGTQCCAVLCCAVRSPSQATVEGRASTPAPTMAQKMCMTAVNMLPVLSFGMLRGGGGQPRGKVLFLQRHPREICGWETRAVLSDEFMHHIRLLQELMTHDAAQACKPGNLLCPADPAAAGAEASCCLTHWGRCRARMPLRQAWWNPWLRARARIWGTDWRSRRRQRLRRAKGPVIPSSADQAGHIQLSIDWKFQLLAFSIGTG